MPEPRLLPIANARALAHSDDYDFALEHGCNDASASLGIQQMPDGYSLMLDADNAYYYWMERATGRESALHWNKWAVYRGAVADARKRALARQEATDA